MRIPMSTWYAFCRQKTRNPVVFRRNRPRFFFSVGWKKCAFELRDGTHFATKKIAGALGVFFSAGPSRGFFFAPSGENAHMGCDLVRIPPPNKTAGNPGFFFGGEIVGTLEAASRFFAHLRKKEFGQLSDQCVWN